MCAALTTSAAFTQILRYYSGKGFRTDAMARNHDGNPALREKEKTNP